MQEAKKLKDILAGVADTFTVSKKRVWDTVKRSVAGFGHDWMRRLYVERPVAPHEAKEFNLPPKSVFLSFHGADTPCLVLYPSTYKDKDQQEHVTVCASSYDYLRSVGVKDIKPSEWEPESDLEDEPEMEP